MQVAAEISFRNCEPSDAVRAEVARQLARLEKFSGRITSCRVVVEARRTRYRQNAVFKVELRLALPRHQDIIVSRSPDDVAGSEHALVAIRAAFHAAQRQIEDSARQMRGDVKTHATPDHGRVARFLAADDCGFIETDDGREVFFRSAAVLDGNFNRLEVGSQVRFVEQQGDKGPQASSVRLIGKHHLV